MRTRAPEGATIGPVPTGPQSTRLLPTAPTDFVPTKPSVHLLLLRCGECEHSRTHETSAARRRAKSALPLSLRSPLPVRTCEPAPPDRARRAEHSVRSRASSPRTRKSIRSELRRPRSRAGADARLAFLRKSSARLSTSSCRSQSSLRMFAASSRGSASSPCGPRKTRRRGSRRKLHDPCVSRPEAEWIPSAPRMTSRIGTTTFGSSAFRAVSSADPRLCAPALRLVCPCRVTVRAGKDTYEIAIGQTREGLFRALFRALH